MSVEWTCCCSQWTETSPLGIESLNVNRCMPRALDLGHCEQRMPWCADTCGGAA